MKKEAPTTEGNDEFVFWRYTDLVERKIVTNRQDLSMKQRNFGFPKPVRLGAQGRNGAALFQRDAVKKWVKDYLNRQR